MFRKISFTITTRVLTALINFGIAVVISQFLGTEGKGEQGIIITTIALIILLSNMVGGPALVYLVPRYHLGLLLIPSYLWSFMVTIICCIILYFFNIVKAGYVVHIGFLSLLCSFIAIHSSFLLGKEKIKANNIITVLQPLINILSLLMFFVVFKMLDVKSYFLSLYFSYIITLLISTYFICTLPAIHEKYVWKEQSEALKALFRFGFINQSNQILYLLSFRISYYFLEKLSGNSVVGIYSNAVSLVESVWLVGGSIAMILYSRISNTNDKQYSIELTKKMLRINILVTFIMMVPLALLPSSFYTMVFGPGFIGINKYIWALAPGIVIYSYAVILVTYFSGTGKFHINLASSAIGLVITLALAVWLIPAFSGTGAAVTASVAYIAAAVFLLWVFHKETRTSLQDIVPTSSFIRNLWNEIWDYLKKAK